jgi:acyl carrier protein
LEWVEEDIPFDMSQMGAIAAPTATAAAAAPTEVATTGKKALSKDAVAAQVMKLARDVVTDDENMAQDVPFMEAGLDSLASVQFVTDVGREFSMNFPPSVIFDFPTARQLVEHIVEESAA